MGEILKSLKRYFSKYVVKYYKSVKLFHIYLVKMQMHENRNPDLERIWPNFAI